MYRSINPLVDSRGNALFLILIAVVLFAALSYAITQSNRSSGNVGKETLEIRASELIGYVGTLRSAITKLTLRGCHEDEISFDSPIWVPLGNNNNNNSNAPASRKCHVFMPEGGGIGIQRFTDDYFNKTLQSANTNWFDTKNYFSFNGVNRIQYIGSDNNGAKSADLLFQMVPISNNLCQAINKKVNLNPPNFTPPTVNYYFVTGFSGYQDNGMFDIEIQQANGMGCVYFSNYGGGNIFIAALTER